MTHHLEISAFSKRNWKWTSTTDNRQLSEIQYSLNCSFLSTKLSISFGNFSTRVQSYSMFSLDNSNWMMMYNNWSFQNTPDFLLKNENLNLIQFITSFDLLDYLVLQRSLIRMKYSQSWNCQFFSLVICLSHSLCLLRWSHVQLTVHTFEIGWTLSELNLSWPHILHSSLNIDRMEDYCTFRNCMKKQILHVRHEKMLKFYR